MTEPLLSSALAIEVLNAKKMINRLLRKRLFNVVLMARDLWYSKL
jgi:hypothetical protein